MSEMVENIWDCGNELYKSDKVYKCAQCKNCEIELTHNNFCISNDANSAPSDVPSSYYFPPAAVKPTAQPHSSVALS